MEYIRRDHADGYPGTRFERPEEVAPFITVETSAIIGINRWAKR